MGRGTLVRTAVALVVLCAAAPAAAQAQALDATIRRTAHGVPHIEAQGYTGIGYGYGYAFAQDNLCVMADQYVTVRGERSRYFGPDGTWSLRGNGSVNRNLDSDFFFKRIIARKTIEKLIDAAPPNGPRPEVREAVRGYTAGYNRYLLDTGAGNLPDASCRGAGWVRPIDEIDVYRRFYQLALLASGAAAIDGIGGAQPPTPPLGGGSGAGALPSAASIEALGDQLPLGGIGSNAYGLGRDRTDNGKGMLLGNPHFPWDGTERFYQAHLTIPGKLDASGGSLFGVPVVLIGHTQGMAWSHTVSTGFRFTPFELALVPGSPTTYLVDGQPREMERTELSVEVRNDDGSISQRTRTLYDTEYGPMFTSLLGQKLFPWTPAKGFAMGDANAANFRYLNHFFETNLAQDTAEYDAVLQRNQGIPWVNSIAADHKGNAYYADISVVPHVTDQKAQQCNTALGQATFAALRLPVLDGARSACNWGRDPSAIQPGTFGPSEHLPSLTRSDYVTNSNDSHWLTNPDQPLTGFPKIIGDEDTKRSLRTRIGLIMAREGAPFTLRRLQDTVFNNRQYAGELWRDPLVEMCRSSPALPSSSGPVVPGEACEVLAAWDVRDDTDSRGALLFRRFAQRALELPGGGFAEPYSSADPVNTPRGLRTEDPAVRQALGDAIAELRDLELPLGGRLGDVQSEERDGERLPIHGGPGTAGVFNAINVRASDLRKGAGYETVPHGSSFVQAVQFVDGGSCPVVPRTILTYSQSSNPQSPFYADQTRKYGRKEFNEVPFCRADVLAATLSTTQVTAGRPVSTSGRACTSSLALRSLSARARGRGLRISVARRGRSRVTVDVLRVSRGRRVTRGTRVARLRTSSGGVTWSGRSARRDGTYVVRVRAGGEVRRIAVVRRNGRFRRRGAFERRSACATVRSFTLASPVFGGAARRSLRIAYRLDGPADAVVQLRRGSRILRTLRRSGRASGRVTLSAKRLRRGAYTVTLITRRGAQQTRTTLSAARL